MSAKPNDFPILSSFCISSSCLFLVNSAPTLQRVKYKTETTTSEWFSFLPNQTAKRLPYLPGRSDSWFGVGGCGGRIMSGFGRANVRRHVFHWSCDFLIDTCHADFVVFSFEGEHQSLFAKSNQFSQYSTKIAQWTKLPANTKLSNLCNYRANSLQSRKYHGYVITERLLSKSRRSHWVPTICTLSSYRTNTMKIWKKSVDALWRLNRGEKQSRAPYIKKKSRLWKKKHTENAHMQLMSNLFDISQKRAIIHFQLIVQFLSQLFIKIIIKH